MIRLDNITLAPGGEPLLIDVNWHLRQGERVGLVGRNGTGKTTLLRAIVGERPADEGRVHVRGSARVGWLPQQAVAGSERTVWDEARQGLTHLVALQERLEAATAAVEAHEDGAIERLDRATEAFRVAGGYRMDEAIGEVLHGLGFGPDAWQRPCTTFSGGWQMRIALAKVLLAQPDLLVLDEPTNHLDLLTRSWLARHLARGPWTVVVVSHDRHLLDQVCTHIVEIRGRDLHTYKGNFSRYLAEKELRIAQAASAFESQQEEIARLERFVERFRAKATKAAQARSRQNTLDRMERLDAPEHDKKPRFRLPPAPPGDAELLALEGADLGYDDGKVVLSGVELILQRGMKVVVLGPNGAGKSTLLQTLAGRLRPLAGRRRQGERIRLGIFDQDLAASLPEADSGLEVVMARAPRAGETRARTVLGALGLPGADALRPISQLSGGEKARVALSVLGASEHNALLLDEPTNHLDAVTVDVLVDALRAFDGALVLVTHDRFLVEQVATHVLRIHDGSAVLTEGVRPEDLEPTAATREGDRDTGPSEGATSHAQRKQLRREQDKLRKLVKDLETEVERLDARIHEIDAALFEHAADYDKARDLSEQRDAAEARQHEAMEEWEQAEARIAELDTELG